ncbi:MAG: hypothetical protein M3Q31_11545 [Actinomycetota bacterium]|nr:hypothetical protein [Actinomycetota bacterium]
MHAPISFVASSFGAAATTTAPPGATAEQKPPLDHSDAISIELPPNLASTAATDVIAAAITSASLLARARLFDGLGRVLTVVR